MSEQSSSVIAEWLECLQEKPRRCRNNQVCYGTKSVKPFERFNRLNIALYKNIPFLHLRSQ